MRGFKTSDAATHVALDRKRNETVKVLDLDAQRDDLVPTARPTVP